MPAMGDEPDGPDGVDVVVDELEAEAEAEAEATPAQRPRLHVRELLRDVLVVYRRHWLRLIIAAAIVFAPLAALDALMEEIHPEGFLAIGTITIGESLFHLIGDVFYTGLVAAAVVAWRAGGPRVGLIGVARSLPWRTGAAVDVVLPVLTAIGFALLIVPGVLVYVYLSLTPAIVELDHVGMREAMRRSWRSVRGNFWRVLLVFVIVLGVSGAVEQLLQDAVTATIGDGLVNWVVQLLSAPFNGLATVLMAYALRPAGPSQGTAEAGE
jgi:hypothetical protein